MKILMHVESANASLTDPG